MTILWELEGGMDMPTKRLSLAVCEGGPADGALGFAIEHCGEIVDFFDLSREQITNLGMAFLLHGMPR